VSKAYEVQRGGVEQLLQRMGAFAGLVRQVKLWPCQTLSRTRMPWGCPLAQMDVSCRVLEPEYRN